MTTVIPVTHSDPVTSNFVSCWRRRCFYKSTSGDLAIKIDGVEPGGKHVWDLWESLKRCQVDERSGCNHHSALRTLRQKKLANHKRSHHRQWGKSEAVYYHLQAGGTERTSKYFQSASRHACNWWKVYNNLCIKLVLLATLVTHYLIYFKTKRDGSWGRTHKWLIMG